MANLTYVAPCFIVGGLKPSVAFYTERLGFETLFIGPGDDPFFAIVGRDKVSIMLKEVAADVKPVPNGGRHEYAPWDAYISTADPDTLYAEYCSRDIAFRRPLRDDGDNLRGFEVVDADGYVLFFGRPN
jgi:hypothetical protein